MEKGVVFVELTEVAGVFRTPSMRLIGRLGERVLAQRDEVRRAGALLVAGLAAFRCGKSGSADVKPSWWQTILKGAGMVSTLWLAFRAKDHDQENKETNGRA